ncbi:MAG TPA: hypothetical protein GX701_09295 [Clostridiales bacterium]|jgi:ABC-type glycerol-3-phosphate transport system substrate-binding protein|nr:hypothetical protein [Clostridiales bacterium]
MEMLKEYIYPNPILNVNRINPDLRKVLLDEVITPVINGDKTPIAAAEAARQAAQAQLNEFFRQN